MSVLFGLPSENVAPRATITATPEDSAYPARNLADLNPGKPSKLTAKSGNWVLDFGTAQRVDLVALWHHNLDARLTVLFQGNDSDSWGAPALSQTITIPALPRDGYPLCPFLDLSAFMVGSPIGYRYYRLQVPNANSANLAIGDLWLAEIRHDFSGALQWGLQETPDHPTVEHETEFRVGTVYDLGVRLRTIRGTVKAKPVLAAMLRDWDADAHGRARASLFIKDSSVNDALFVRFAPGGLTETARGPSMSFFDFVVNEIGRGLPL